LKKDNVARHHRLSVYDEAAAVAYDCCLERQHSPNGVHGLFGLALLDKTAGGIDDPHRKDHASIDPVAERGRDNARRKKHIEEDIVELQQESEKHATPLRRR
jgi:hypothetical protein